MHHQSSTDRLRQYEGQDFKSFVTTLKSCAADCDFTCPHDKKHCLIEYHLINKIRSGVYDAALQQELLQKSETLNTLELITNYCTNYESAKQDQEKLAAANPSSIAAPIYSDDLPEEEIIAAISQYKKNKKAESKKAECMRCGEDWPHPGGMDACPGKGHICKICKKPNHLESVC